MWYCDFNNKTYETKEIAQAAVHDVMDYEDYAAWSPLPEEALWRKLFQHFKFNVPLDFDNLCKRAEEAFFNEWFWEIEEEAD